MLTQRACVYDAEIGLTHNYASPDEHKHNEVSGEEGHELSVT